MSYKIVFNPRYSRWEVKVRTYIFFWAAAKEQGEVLRYSTLDEAQQFVSSVGLLKSYAEHRSIFAKLPDYTYIETN